MNKNNTCSGITIAAAAPAPAASQSSSSSAEPCASPSSSPARGAVLAFVCLLRLVVIGLMSQTIARSAWRARGDPWELAAVVGPTALLAGIFVCLHRAERLTPESPPGERRRLQVAVWALTTALSCVLAYRVSLAMPTALAAVVWGMTSVVVAVGFYLLVLCRDDDRQRQEQQQYRRVEEQVHDDDADDGDGGGKSRNNKTKHADELV